MNDDVVARPRVAPLRFVVGWALRIVLLVLTTWALAGFFMDGEDELDHVVPWLVILGGSVADERIDLACKLFSQGHGYQGVVLTGPVTGKIMRQRSLLTKRCGVPADLMQQWPAPANSFQELSAVATMLLERAGTQAIVVSDSLHMPRLRYVRERLAINGRVYFRQSRLRESSDPAYLAKIAIFWFREPLAYVYYRLRY
jgi:uncharacterized SAM-binding protein YcdF (DUF218 family)